MNSLPIFHLLLTLLLFTRSVDSFSEVCWEEDGEGIGWVEDGEGIGSVEGGE